VDETRALTLKKLLLDPVLFIRYASGLRLRRYQQAVVTAVVDAVLRGRGLSLVVMFPRQSGKNECQAQIEAYLLTLLMQTDAEIVKICPTWKPQAQNAMHRLERVLRRNRLTAGLWQREAGYIYRVGRARILFLSGAPEANIVGATASTLLEIDEAQDVSVAKYDKDIAPMAAATNATRVFWGTAWSHETLLARELRAAEAAQAADGRRRVFRVGAEEVAAEVPAYGRFVAEQVARLGRQHPLIRTQFFSEEIATEGGLFPPERRARMQGEHALCLHPEPGRLYAFLLDVAGADEGLEAGEALRHPERDVTALTVVEVDRSSLEDAARRAPTYRCVYRQAWVGVAHPTIYAEVAALAQAWQARYVVVDATGVGAGLAGFLERALPGRVLPFQFSAASKSRLGWAFLSLVDAGRWLEPRLPEEPALPLFAGPESERLNAVAAHSRRFWQQVAHCRYHLPPGPEKHLRWGVPEGLRLPGEREPLHDDWLLSAALAALLDAQPWGSGGAALVVPGRDPLRDLDLGF